MTWREKIEYEIKEKGLNQRQFCKYTGIHTSELNNVIHKNRSLSIKLSLALESMQIKTAEYWLGQQLKEQITEVKKKYVIYKN